MLPRVIETGFNGCFLSLPLSLALSFLFLCHSAPHLVSCLVYIKPFNRVNTLQQRSRWGLCVCVFAGDNAMIWFPSYPTTLGWNRESLKSIPKWIEHQVRHIHNPFSHIEWPLPLAKRNDKLAKWLCVQRLPTCFSQNQWNAVMGH